MLANFCSKTSARKCAKSLPPTASIMTCVIHGVTKLCPKNALALKRYRKVKVALKKHTWKLKRKKLKQAISRVFWIFLPNATEINSHNVEQVCRQSCKRDVWCRDRDETETSESRDRDKIETRRSKQRLETFGRDSRRSSHDYSH